MKKSLFLFLLLSFFSCSKVPVSDRPQLILISDEQMAEMSKQSYQEFMDEAVVSKDQINKALLNEVGRDITNAVETYLRENGRSGQIKYFSWSFTLVESSQVNAFCMPGGQIVFYDGILPYTQNATGMAVVMGHEIAHAVAKHSAEQITKQIFAQYGLEFMSMLISGQSDALRSVINSVYGLGSNVWLLKYSREHEYEADYLGLIFMAMAGYDPSEAVDFWERMSANSGNTIEFLSTHPTSEHRIQQIKDHLPEALEIYEKSKK